MFPGEILLQFGYLLTSPCPLYGWFLCTAYEMHKKVTTITKKLFLSKNLPFYSFFVLFLKCFFKLKNRPFSKLGAFQLLCVQTTVRKNSSDNCSSAHGFISWAALRAYGILLGLGRDLLPPPEVSKVLDHLPDAPQPLAGDLPGHVLQDAPQPAWNWSHLINFISWSISRFNVFSAVLLFSWISGLKPKTLLPALLPLWKEFTGSPQDFSLRVGKGLYWWVWGHFFRPIHFVQNS